MKKMIKQFNSAASKNASAGTMTANNNNIMKKDGSDNYGHHDHDPSKPSSAPSVQKPYNNYNIFFILERVRLIEARKGSKDSAAAGNDEESHKSQQQQSSDASGNSSIITGSTGYEDLDLPPLPARYQHLKTVLPPDWFVPGKRKKSKRKHKATHGRECLLI